MMLAGLRAELKAITEWSRQSQILRTQTEREAVVIREMAPRNYSTADRNGENELAYFG